MVLSRFILLAPLLFYLFHLFIFYWPKYSVYITLTRLACDIFQVSITKMLLVVEVPHYIPFLLTADD